MYAIKSDFTSMVSHELRTPLTAIKEAIAIVLDGSAGEINADQKEFLNMAKSNIDRLKRLIDDVLDFSKLESRRLKFKMQDADINLIIKEVTVSQKSVVEERKLYLNSELQATIPKVKLDPDRINQVLYNLIGNAIKFTKSGGVTVITRDVRQGGEDVIEVCIKDTGEGIRKEDLSKLFQKFQQLGDANQKKTGGTGLGLAISRNIVEQHGGSIWVESEYGKGSEFKFTIPVKVRLKVLIIDDEEIVLDLCEKVLKSDGFLVLRSEEGAKGIDIIQTDRPDLIVLDIRLKDTNGYDVIASVKNDKNTAATPILVMSGYAEEIEKIKGKKEELALSWISKPFDNQEFLFKIKSALEKHA
jgi:CheY-like chemotaxis protein